LRIQRGEGKKALRESNGEGKKWFVCEECKMRYGGGGWTDKYEKSCREKSVVILR
jgi:hypothetical protein